MTSVSSVPPEIDSDVEEFDFQELIGLLVSGRWLIFFVTIAFNILAIAYVVLAAPTYQADGLVQVEQDQKGLASATHDIESLLVGESTESEAEIQILQSRLVLGKVIEKLKLEIAAVPKSFPIFGRALLASRSRLDTPAQPWLGLSSFAWGGEHITVSRFDVPREFLDKRFRLRKEEKGISLFDYDENKVLSSSGTSAVGSTTYGDVRIDIEDLRARPGTDFIVKKRSMDDVLEQLGKNYKVAEEGKSSGVIGLTLTGYSPEYVASVITEIEDAYVSQNVKHRSEEAGASLDYLQKQLPEVKATLGHAQGRLNAYQLKQGSVDVAQETTLLLNKTVDLDSQRLQLVQQKELNLQHFTAQHPTILAIDSQIAQIDIQKALVDRSIKALPQTQQDILELQRDVDVNSNLYTSLINTIQQLQLAKAGTVGDVRVVDYPLIPVKPSAPKILVVLIGGMVVGLLIGCLWVYVRRVFIKGIDRPEIVEKMFGLSTYAIIPYSNTQKKIEFSFKRKTPGSRILAISDSGDLAIEAIRSLRSSLHFATLEASNNVVMFTGPSPGLGKSFVTINLGAVLAATGKTVAVVDTDLRRGHLYRYLDLGIGPGVSDYIVGDSDMAAVVQPTSVDGMFFVSCGKRPPNPSEILMHEKFDELINYLEKRFDYVLIDTSPVLAVTDAAIVGRTAGTVLLVLKAAEHPVRAIAETVRRLKHAGVTPKGVLFNQFGARLGTQGYGGYGSDYYTAYDYKPEA